MTNVKWFGGLAAVCGMIAGSVAVAQQVSPVASVDAEIAAAPMMLSAESRALRAEVEADGDPALLAAYEARDFAPLWTPARQQALLAAIAAAPDHAMPLARYEPERVRIADVGADAPVADDIALTRIFLRYARDINSGLIEPRSADRDIVIKPRRPEASALLAGFASADDPAAFLGDLAPTHPDYDNLLAEKARLEALIAEGGWGETVPGGGTLREGDSSARIVALRARLGRMDGVDYGEDPIFDLALADALKAFQLRHGLNDDGVLGPKTLAAVNASAEDRLRQVFVNLERQRWLNYDRGARHIYVNQADFSVQVIDEGETSLWSRVVIGQRKHRSQEFVDEMTHMVVNPTWHVPRSIATEEMLPELQQDPGALGSSMQVMTRSGTAVNPMLVDFTQFNQRNFPFLIKQQPGSGNALGRVKFMFPNQFNIYLHDTPQKHLFARDVRAFSHGCIRVQKPFELAHLLLSAQTSDPVGMFENYLVNGRERTIVLDEPVPVYLTYQSAWVDNFGIPQYRGDIYDRDAAVFRALQETGVSLLPVEG